MRFLLSLIEPRPRFALPRHAGLCERAFEATTLCQDSTWGLCRAARLRRLFQAELQGTVTLHHPVKLVAATRSDIIRLLLHKQARMEGRTEERSSPVKGKAFFPSSFRIKQPTSKASLLILTSTTVAQSYAIHFPNMARCVCVYICVLMPRSTTQKPL